MKNLELNIENAKLTLGTLTSVERPNAKTKRQITVLQKNIAKMEAELLSEVPASEEPKLEVNTEMLNKLSAMNITDKVKTATDKRSIFKKEFNNKSDRTKCRTKFLNAISLFLLHTAHNKKDLALEALEKAKELSKTYYSAEDNFLKSSDYYTENMEETKKNQIKYFIEVVNA